MSKMLKVGIIGATGGWAKESHVPAVQKLKGLELTAVATSNEKTAAAAAKEFGVKSSYGSGLELIRDPDVDLVTVAVRVPDHRELVLAALKAGKHVYCEWPLGRNVAEAEEMAAAAKASGVHAAIGLQTRASPAGRVARELITSQSLGRILSIRAYSSTAGFGPDVPEPYVYLEVPENGANLVTIQGAHTIDLVIALTGGFANAISLASAQYPEILLGKEKKTSHRTTFDHILVQAQSLMKAPVAIEVTGGRPPNDTPFRLEVTGESGTLSLEGGAARGFQSGTLSLSLNGQHQHPGVGELAPMQDSAVNVAGMYAQLRDDINNGTSLTVDFDHAIKLTRLIEELLTSSREGRRRVAGNWPRA